MMLQHAIWYAQVLIWILLTVLFVVFEIRSRTMNKQRESYIQRYERPGMKGPATQFEGRSDIFKGKYEPGSILPNQ
jgi:hypothetical protein